jgi:hypothetical protein
VVEREIPQLVSAPFSLANLLDGEEQHRDQKPYEALQHVVEGKRSRRLSYDLIHVSFPGNHHGHQQNQ